MASSASLVYDTDECKGKMQHTPFGPVNYSELVDQNFKKGDIFRIHKLLFKEKSLFQKQDASKNWRTQIKSVTLPHQNLLGLDYSLDLKTSLEVYKNKTISERICTSDIQNTTIRCKSVQSMPSTLLAAAVTAGPDGGGGKVKKTYQKTDRTQKRKTVKTVKTKL